MEGETEENFKFDWNIDARKFTRLTAFKPMKSPIAYAENLKKTQWYLKLFISSNIILISEHTITCCLIKNDSVESEKEYMTVTFKIQVLDSEGKVLKSVLKVNRLFSRNSCNIDDLLTGEFLEFLEQSGKLAEGEILTFRCHIIEENHRERAKIQDFPVAMQTQWNFKFLGFNWWKKILVPFHNYIYIYINIFICAYQEKIEMTIRKGDLEQPYTLKITVLNYENCEIDLKESKDLFHSTDKKETFVTWFEKCQIVNKSQLHLPYSFTLICRVHSMGNGNSLRNPIGESLPFSKVSPLPLQEDLKEMLLKEKHSDIKLRSHGDIIPAHKCLLSVRSPVFSTMFDQDMLETQTGIVDIPDVESGTLRAFLEYLYTDTIPTTDFEEVLKLLLVADKYQVNALIDRCSKILMSSLSLENVCEVMSVSEMLNQTALKSRAFNFIKENKQEIISSPTWPSWVENNMKLSVEILSKLIID